MLWKEALQSSMAEAMDSRKGELQRKREASMKECLPSPPSSLMRLGWSKRYHKHSYNAKSGVAVIIGKETYACEAGSPIPRRH